MDELDRRIIEILQSDASIPLTKIADTLGVPRPTIYLRFNKMKENGIILGFNLVLGDKAENKPKRSAILKTKDYLISDMGRRIVSNLGEKLARRGDVLFAARISKNEILVVWMGEVFRPESYGEVIEVKELNSEVFKSPK